VISRNGRDHQIPCPNCENVTKVENAITARVRPWSFPKKRMIARAKQLGDMASECRSIAGITKDHRRNLLEVADQLERLAWHYESIEKNTRSLKGSC
jgi:hypothetical protein